MPTISLTDERVFKVMDFVVKNKIKGIKSEHEFLVSIGYTPGNITLVRKGTQSFRIQHLVKICELYNVDGNYFLNKKYNKMMNEGKFTNPVVNLKLAVAMIEDYIQFK